MTRPHHIASIVLLTATATACALTRNAPPREVRYFSPEPSSSASPSAPASAAAPEPLPVAESVHLRLGRVERVDVLDHRIVLRTSPVELTRYETRRWTERPDEFVRRALLDALFASRPLVRVLAGPAPTLDVEVLAFEEVLSPRHLGRVRLRYVLHDRRTVLASGHLVAEAPVVGDDFPAVVQAIAAANHDAAAQLADHVRRRLCSPPAAH